MARPPPRRADAPLAPSPRADRASARSARRLLVAYLNLDKVIKIIRNEDEPKPVLMKTFKLTDVQADAILNMRLRNLRKLEEMEIRQEDKDLRSREEGARKAADAPRSEQWKTVAGADQGGAREVRRRRRRSASAAPRSPRRRSTTRPRSKRRWSSASRSPSSCRRRAGSARCAATSTDLSGVAFKTDDELKFVVLRRRRRRSSWCSPPTAASTRSRPRSCRAGAATASRSGCSSTSSRTPTWSRCFRIQRRPQVHRREPRRAAASSCRRTSASPTPARASRCSTSSLPDEARAHRAGRGRAGRDASARTARWWSSRSSRCRR